MVCKRREEVRGSRVKSVRREFWQERLRLMEGRNGFVNSVLKPMCGRGGVAGDATTISQQGCVESTGRRLRQKLVKGPRSLRRRVERKTRSFKVKMLRFKSFGPRFERLRRQGKEQVKTNRMARSERRVKLRKTGAWEWKRRPTEERSWTSRGKDFIGNCVMSRVSLIHRRRLREYLQRQLQEVEQKRRHILLEHQRVQKRSEKIQSIQDKKKNIQRETAPAEDEMQKVREEIVRNEERFRLLSDEVDENRMAEAGMKAELQGLQAGEERRGSTAS